MADKPAQKQSFSKEMAGLFRAVANLFKAAIPSHESQVELPETVDQLFLPAPDAHFEHAQLLTEHSLGWHVPHPSKLATPSYAPAMTAFGIVFIALGAVTVWPLSVIGAVIFLLAIGKWIGELLHD